MKIIAYVLIVLVMTACAKVEKKIILIETSPEGAKISVSEKNDKSGEVVRKEIGLSPAEYEITLPKFTNNSSMDDGEDDIGTVPRAKQSFPDHKYIVFASKDGYFAEEKAIVDYDNIFESGKFLVRLEQSPLWWETTISTATNQWINLIVSPEISDVDMWQRVVDAVTKRFPDLKEYDFTSGYLVTVPKIKSFTTSRGTFLLRSKFIATVMERDPLTYRLKLVSEWSDREAVKWHLYPRVFKEDAELVEELMSRFQAY